MKAQPTTSRKARQGSRESSRAPGKGQQAEALVDQRQDTLQQRQLQELMSSGPSIQTKLTIGAVDDPLEREADRVAEQVMRMPEPSPTLSQPQSSNQASVQLLSLNAEASLQRQTPDSGDADGEEQLLQAKQQSGQIPEVSPNIEAQIQTARGSGQPLPLSTRAFFEPRFGADFSGVRLHTGGIADTLNQAIHARAFTTGQDVFFRRGEYDVGSAKGNKLLAHELTHVVQQNGGICSKLVVGGPEDQYDQMADQQARHLMRTPEPKSLRYFPECEVQLQRKPTRKKMPKNLKDIQRILPNIVAIDENEIKSLEDVYRGKKYLVQLPRISRTQPGDFNSSFYTPVWVELESGTELGSSKKSFIFIGKGADSGTLVKRESPTLSQVVISTHSGPDFCNLLVNVAAVDQEVRKKLLRLTS